MKQERASCTVRALAAVASIEYDLAHKIAADAGRTRSRGFKSAKLVEEAKAQGVNFHKLRMGTRTLRKFLREHPVGRFYVRKRGHAFAVIDGAPSDATPLGSIIRDAWQFTQATT